MTNFFFFFFFGGGGGGGGGVGEGPSLIEVEVSYIIASHVTAILGHSELKTRRGKGQRLLRKFGSR